MLSIIRGVFSESLKELCCIKYYWRCFQMGWGKGEDRGRR